MVEKQKKCLVAEKSTVKHALTWYTPPGTLYISHEPLSVRPTVHPVTYSEKLDRMLVVLSWCEQTVAHV